MSICVVSRGLESIGSCKGLEDKSILLGLLVATIGYKASKARTVVF